MSTVTEAPEAFQSANLSYLYEGGLPNEIHVSQQSQDVDQDTFHVPGPQRRKHVHILQSHLASNHPIQKMTFSHLCDDAPVIPETQIRHTNHMI